VGPRRTSPAAETAAREAVERPAPRTASPSAGAPRLLIERVTPAIDGGRWPVKRVVGDVLEVGADMQKDGHDLLAARVLWRGPGDDGWRRAPMRYDFDTDRWSASVLLERVGRWTFTVEAWADWFGTWRSDLEKRLAVGQDVASELLEGGAFLARTAALAEGETRAAVERAAAVLRDPRTPAEERARAALDPVLAGLLADLVDEREVTRHDRELPVVVDRAAARFAAWYEMFPRSQGTEPGRHGTFIDAIRALPRLAELGFDVVYLPPIHPIGRTYRKGPDNTLAAGPGDPGSPWAIGNEDGGHTAIEPQLGTLDDFDRFVDAARALGLEVALDYALQCSPDHPWAREHPQWFFVRPDGTIKYAENPPKKYQDIYPLDFWCEDRDALWCACRDVLEFWIGHGVRTFRVDNPHTKPLAFWEWMIADVQASHPDVVFLAEAFTRPKRMQALAKLGFSQSYTYFTWRNTAHELREYLTELAQPEMVDFFRPNFFANTPDILHAYLQEGGRPAFRIRLLLAATLSPLYGIYSGFELCERTPAHAGSEEYLHSEKYEIRVRDWQAPGHINADVQAVNRIRREHPALQRLDNVSFHDVEAEEMLCYRKAAPPGGADLLIVVNLDPHHAREGMVHVPLEALGIGWDEPFLVHDLLTGERWAWRGVRNYVRLDPAERVAHLFRVERI
jgi:starch synthase (maltosyl-transferring)